MNAALIWDPSFIAYRFRPDHPFNPRRLELAVSLIEALGLVDDDRFPLVPPRLASEDEIARIHSPEYIRAIKQLGREPDAPPEEARRWGLGSDDNPIFPDMHEVASLVVGGTLRAAELVMSGECRTAFAIAGGLHHAHRASASGFCIYSDLAIAIDWIRREHQARVLYIDYDAHHGDGVQSIFYHDPNVLTFSIHESGRYLFPGTGFVDELGEGEGYGYSMNLPMEPFTEDDSWIGAYRDLLPDIAAAFRPDVIMLVNGCDAHMHDPLTHLRCTTRMFEEVVALTMEVADEYCDGRIVATGAGGYAIWRTVPRAWSLTWAKLSGQHAPDVIPREWLNRWQGESPYLLPERLRDSDGAFPPVPRRAAIESTNRRTVQELRRTGLPLLRGWGLGF